MDNCVALLAERIWLASPPSHDRPDRTSRVDGSGASVDRQFCLPASRRQKKTDLALRVRRPCGGLLSEGGGAGSGGAGRGASGGEGGGGEGGTEEEPRWRGANAKSMSAAPTAWGRPTRCETDLWREQRNRDVSKATRRRRAQVRVFCECCINHVVLHHGRCSCRRDARRMLRQRLVRWRPGVRLCSIARSCAP